MKWFRFYAEAMRDPKILKLTDKEFRFWVRCLAYACENDGRLPREDDLKRVFNMRLDHLSTLLKRLSSHGLIDPLKDGYEPHNWSKRQYKSDSSTDRVRKHRLRRNVSQAVTVTPPDTDTETEAAATRFHEVGRAVLKLIGADTDPNCRMDYSRVDTWLNAGADPDKHIYPTIRRIMAGRGDWRPGSLAYFDKPIAEAMENGTRPLPKAQGGNYVRTPLN